MHEHQITVTAKFKPGDTIRDLDHNHTWTISRIDLVSGRVKYFGEGTYSLAVPFVDGRYELVAACDEAWLNVFPEDTSIDWHPSIQLCNEEVDVADYPIVARIHRAVDGTVTVTDLRDAQ